MSRKVVGSMSKWSGLLKDFFRQIDDESINLGNLRSFLEHKNPFGETGIISYWQDFYQKHFGIKIDKIDLSNLKIPEKKQGDFTWPIITIEQINEQMLYDKCQELFPCCKQMEKPLNKVLNPDITSKGTHLAFFRDRIEADEELKNLSAEDLKEKNIQAITLKQRLVMEINYFTRTGNHLDVQNITLCAGSLCFDGLVPVVHWDDGKMRVDWDYSVSRSGHLRSRQAVS